MNKHNHNLKCSFVNHFKSIVTNNKHNHYNYILLTKQSPYAAASNQ